jgi:hypothetical protein
MPRPHPDDHPRGSGGRGQAGRGGVRQLGVMLARGEAGADAAKLLNINARLRYTCSDRTVNQPSEQ